MLQVAKILKPCGLRGEVKCIPYSTDPTFWHKVKEVFVDGKSLKVVGSRIYRDFVYLTFDGLHKFDDADILRNKEIFADESLISRASGEFLISELVGISVAGDNGEDFGVIDSIEKYGSADIINIKRNGAIYSFPFLNALIIRVDIEGNKMIVSSAKMAEVLI